MKRIFSILLSVVLMISLCACNKTTPTNNEKIPYSIGLQENGYYVDYDKFALDYTYDMEVQQQDLEDFITKMLRENQGDPNLTFNDYIDMFTNNFLASYGFDTKDIVEPTDIVNISLQFIDSKGEEMPEYNQTANYTANPNGDSIIASLIGHKVGDQYSVEYTFPDDDEYYPSETVTVNISIQSCVYADPITGGVVETRLDEINEVLDGVKDLETLKDALLPYVLAYHLQDYIKETLILQDIPIPPELVEHERQRLYSRLYALDLTYEQYLTSAQMTDKDVNIMCERNARENLIALAIYSQRFEPVTEEDLAEAYGEENVEYYAKLQGRPYLKLRLMRMRVFYDLAKTTNIIGTDGKALDLSIFFAEETELDTSAQTETTPTT